MFLGRLTDLPIHFGRNVIESYSVLFSGTLITIYKTISVSLGDKSKLNLSTPTRVAKTFHFI
jgi:hypothetical protein